MISSLKNPITDSILLGKGSQFWFLLYRVGSLRKWDSTVV